MQLLMPTILASKLLIISVVSMLVPFIADRIKTFHVPPVVFEIILGIIIGPDVLNLIQPAYQLEVLARIGLIVLIFLAGYEIDVKKIMGQPLNLACLGWILSLLIAIGIAYTMRVTGFELDPVFIGLALTTTGLSVLLPILQDENILKSNVGLFILAAATLGEFGPIFALSVLLSESKPLIAILFILLFVTVCVISAFLAVSMRKPHVIRMLRQHLHTSSQLPVRISMFMIFLLIFLALQLKLNVLIGAFSAGILVNFFTQKQDDKVIESKLKAIGFGFLIPLFFIISGTNFDLASLGTLQAQVRMLLFLVSLLLVRGLPAYIFYRNIMDRQQQRALALFSSTGLPLIVVITHLGVASGHMLRTNATAMVGAGILSVLIFPLLGLRYLKKSPIK